MEQLIPTLEDLLEALRPAFRQEVYHMFGLMVVAWIVCLGRRTISRVWETTGQTDQRNHAAAYRLFSHNTVRQVITTVSAKVFFKGGR